MPRQTLRARRATGSTPPSDTLNPNQHPRIALPPFDNNLNGSHKADIILHTPDNVTFYAHKLILSLASTFFRDTFSIPQASNVDSEQMEVIDLAESSTILDGALRFCYPVDDPEFDLAQSLSLVIDAMAKYQMVDVIGRAQTLLESRFLEEDPVRIFAIAYRYGWKTLARTAAEKTRCLPLPHKFVHELDFIPTRVYHSLNQYHANCSEGIRMMVGNPEYYDKTTSKWWSDHPCQNHESQWDYPTGQDEIDSFDSRTWYSMYMLRLSDQLSRRPCLETIEENSWILQAALTEAGDCGNCCQVALQCFYPWVEGVLTQEIVHALGQVTANAT